jgi:hypothetical protein
VGLRSTSAIAEGSLTRFALSLVKVRRRSSPALPALVCGERLSRCHSTVTDFAKLRGWSISQPFLSPTW